jgi:hypothetical protein
MSSLYKDKHTCSWLELLLEFRFEVLDELLKFLMGWFTKLDTKFTANLWNWFFVLRDVGGELVVQRWSVNRLLYGFVEAQHPNDGFGQRGDDLRSARGTNHKFQLNIIYFQFYFILYFFSNYRPWAFIFRSSKKTRKLNEFHFLADKKPQMVALIRKNAHYYM